MTLNAISSIYTETSPEDTGMNNKLNNIPLMLGFCNNKYVHTYTTDYLRWLVESSRSATGLVTVKTYGLVTNLSSYSKTWSEQINTIEAITLELALLKLGLLNPKALNSERIPMSCHFEPRKNPEVTSSRLPYYFRGFTTEPCNVFHIFRAHIWRVQFSRS